MRPFPALIRSCRLGTCLLAALVLLAAARAATPDVTFVFTSDVHFGLSRGKFRNATYVDAAIVNAAMVQKINLLPATSLPDDGGLHAGRPVGPVDFVVITGDLTNREELYPVPIQSSAASWAQFKACFIDGLKLTDPQGQPTALYLVPGNHDVSNSIGSPSVLRPVTDATAMTEIYNRMMHPAAPITPAQFRYPQHRTTYSHDIGGAHCIFLTMWPDSYTRAWIDRDLQTVSADTPVFLFCHDPPDIDARHLINPNGDHSINRDDGFENLVSDVYADGDVGKHNAKPDGSTKVEQQALAAFLRRHPNIVGYFHGHSNWNEFYTWAGPEGDLHLNTFRADSPLKGKNSKVDTLLSFQVIVYNAGEHRLTARECLWNAKGKADGPTVPVGWGESKTVSLR